MLEAPVFRPTAEEFADFTGYISYVEARLNGSGICKIIPPQSWSPKNSYKNIRNKLIIKNPIRQHVSGSNGIYQVANFVECNRPLRDFQKQAELKEKGTARSKKSRSNIEQLENWFWNNLCRDPPLYGADILGSLFNDDVPHWNLKKLGSLLDHLPSLPGINAPYLYFGMMKALFACHIEDMNLYSLNYLHFGKTKVWYALGPSQAHKFEEFAAKQFSQLAKACPEYLRHKTSLISPVVLEKNGFLVSHAHQEPGEFIVTFPAAYHFGFNSGFNCAEAVNFANEKWLEIGARAKVCRCVSDSVSIDMNLLRERILQMKASRNEDAWMFSCRCGRHEGITNSHDKSTHPEGNMFECSTCQIWGHVDCYHEYLGNHDVLPEDMFCYRCLVLPRKKIEDRQKEEEVDNGKSLEIQESPSRDGSPPKINVRITCKRGSPPVEKEMFKKQKVGGCG
eukprot:TRINITY_DN6608_c0_g1_i1.p1 TRINITY_DN6608_c0_g1~~TRINITY_DN6608_c0_g1_i1.p1  ORF type:complete len:451 (+),score=98.55 TRINITY_DN6608_c0_g1_i1:102-1454(+)